MCWKDVLNTQFIALIGIQWFTMQWGPTIFFGIGAIRVWISKGTFDSNIGAPTCLMIKSDISRKILIFEVFFIKGVLHP